MDQLTQNLKDGKMQILEVPYPALNKGCVLVRNHYSLISAGTEGKTVKDARLGYIGKARARRDEVKKVFEAARSFGMLNTYRMVMNKLDAPAPLGYSCAGEVIAVADDVRDYSVGDKVACGGNTAVHAEVVSVPVNLCVKLSVDADMKAASYTTLGAIALQGVRQADLRLGESCAVIGLGLVGQLTMQLLRAAGVQTIGIDIDKEMVDLAASCGAGMSLSRQEENLEERVQWFTGGHGTDAVIIAAGTDSHDPIDLAGTLCRKKGRVVVVGAVPTGFKRPNYFRKELELRMSGSYGPGRYDPEYEEMGIDYPYAYVRWTENRNMQAFASLLADGSIHTDKLTTHIFEFNNASKAYDLVLNKTEPYVGMLLAYDTGKKLKQKIEIAPAKFAPAEVNIGLIGAGSFGQNFLIPALKGNGNFVGVVTARPGNARNMASKHGFSFASGDAKDVFDNEAINTIFIASRHDSHAAYVIEALRREKNVFTEKPLCLDESGLNQVANACATSGARLMVGFNRRFAPMTARLKQSFPEGAPVAINMRINAGIVPPDHWIHHPETGGGRIIGEACHFIDLANYLAGSHPESVSAVAMRDARGLNDTLTMQLRFKNGSVASIAYFSNGNKLVAKESIEVFGSGIVAQIDDFKELVVSGKTEKKFTSAQDKGHAAGVKAFCNSIRNALPAPVTFDDIYMSMLATFRVHESLAQGGKTIHL